jgi:beta-lactamase superfamily II metal-dependent hydrolase
MRTSAKILGIALSFLLAATVLVWYAAIRGDHRGILTVSFLNVGQGDAIFIEAPSGRQILIDGGPDNSVIRQLGQMMPFYDRSIDMIIATAQVPSKVGGLTSVLSRYSVAAIVRSAAVSGAPQVQAFAGAVSSAQQNGTRLLIVQRGQMIDLGGGSYIEIFFPDRDASQMAPSDACLVLKLVFGSTSFLFSCGSPTIENYLATLDGAKLKSEVLFATGNDTELFVGFASPQFAVVPCGASAMSTVFSTLDVQTFDTCQDDLTFVSDGQAVTRK